MIWRKFFASRSIAYLRLKFAEQLAPLLDSAEKRRDDRSITSDPIQDRWAVGQRKVTASLIAGPLKFLHDFQPLSRS